MNSHAEIKELETMLKEENLSLSETKFVQETLKRFKKKENRDLVSTARVVGTLQLDIPYIL